MKYICYSLRGPNKSRVAEYVKNSIVARKADAINTDKLFVLGVVIFALMVGLVDKSYSQTGTITVTSPANNSTVSSNFIVNLTYSVSWPDNNTHNTGTCGQKNPYDSTEIGTSQMSYTYNAGSKLIVASAYYSIDNGAKVFIRDIYNGNVVVIPVSIDIGSLSSGSHSVTFSLVDVSSTRCYYDASCGQCHGSKYTTSSWERVNGASNFASTKFDFKVLKPITAAPSLITPDRFFTGSTSGGNVTLKWDAVPANAYGCIVSLSPDSSFKENESNAILITTNERIIPQWKFPMENKLAKVYWRVRGESSDSTIIGPYSEAKKFINGPQMECFPEVGTGSGSDHIDTCYFEAEPKGYRLRDISRRKNMNIDGHNGDMADSSAIVTRQFGTNTAMVDIDNTWSDILQKSGIDAQINAEKTYDYLWSTLKLSSPDGKGGSMANVVESTDPRCCPDEACFDSAPVTPTIHFCAGTSFSSSLDAVAHEWGHAITSRASIRSGSLDTGEAGTINEAFSDWIAIATKQAYGDTSWLISPSGTTFMRSLSDPASVSNPRQPDTYGQGPYWINTYNCTPTELNDSCGVHINNGVPNKMFFLLSHPGVNAHNNVSTIGIGIDKAIRIAYHANISKWVSVNLTFKDARDGMISAANDLFGLGSWEAAQVENAWNAVGVTSNSTPESLLIKKVLPVLTGILLEN